MIRAKDILERTVLLARDQVPSTIPDGKIVDAFAGATVGVRVSTEVLDSPGGLTALETLRVLLAGLCMPMRLEISGGDKAIRLRPPFDQGHWLEALHRYRSQASAPLEVGPLANSCLLELSLGVHHDGSFHLGADGQDSYFGQTESGLSWAAASPWTGARTAVLAAAEAYKAVLRRLTAGHPVAEQRRLELRALNACCLPLPHSVNISGALGFSDFVSAGAINNCALFMLIRLNTAIKGRIWDRDLVEASNLNRYPLLDVESLGLPKVETIARIGSKQLSIVPRQERFDSASEAIYGAIVVGADRVDARWEAARRRPALAIIGATDHCLTMDSSHSPTSLGCPGCVHPLDDGVVDKIPTASFVSFAAGLGVAFRWFRGPSVGSYTLIPSWLQMDSTVSQIVCTVPRNPRCPTLEAHSS